MMANITFLSFLLFSMCHSIHVAVDTWLNCSFFTFGINGRLLRVELNRTDMRLAGNNLD